jgi:CrcB protein
VNLASPLFTRRSHIHRLAPYLWISLGAILGANLRYVVSRWLAQWLGTGFPFGTFAVNILGCLAIGFVGTMVTGRLVARPEVVRLVVMVGFLGSLTTFSSFAYETHNLFNDGAWMRALTNLFLSLFAGLVGVRLGVHLTPQIGGLL